MGGDAGDHAVDEDLLLAIQRLGRLMASRQVASELAAAAGVELSQQGVQLVRTLGRSGRVSIADLAARGRMDVAAVSRQLRVLEDDGFVRRSTSPSDGRVVLVELTLAGAKAAARLRDVGLRHLAESLAGWSSADRRRVATLLSRLVADLQRTDIRPATP